MLHSRSWKQILIRDQVLQEIKFSAINPSTSIFYSKEYFIIFSLYLRVSHPIQLSYKTQIVLYVATFFHSLNKFLLNSHNYPNNSIWYQTSYDLVISRAEAVEPF